MCSYRPEVLPWTRGACIARSVRVLNMYLQNKKVGKWKDYLYGERVYIILSLTAKTVLAWIIWSGTLAP